MSDRRLSEDNTKMRDTLRALEDRLGRVEVQLRSQQQGITPAAGVRQLIGNGDIEIEVSKSGVEDGRIVTFRNRLTGTEQTIVLP